MEILNLQYEAEKMDNTNLKLQLGMKIKKPGSDVEDPKKTAAAAAATKAAADKARKDAEELQKKLGSKPRRKSDVAPGGVAPAPVISGPGFSLTPK
jgi:hypothetical protein